MFELCEGGSTVEGLELRQVGVGARAAMFVDCDPARDRVRPGAEMLAVPEVGIPAERAQERFLEGVLGAIRSEPTDEESEDLFPVLLVEALEGRQGHPRHLETQKGSQV